MKIYIIAAAFSIAATAAVAADVAPKVEAPTCGKTAEECQKIVNELNGQLQNVTMAYNAARNQRNALQAQIDDNAIVSAIQQAQAQQAANAAAEKEKTAAPKK